MVFILSIIPLSGILESQIWGFQDLYFLNYLWFCNLHYNKLSPFHGFLMQVKVVQR